MLRTVAYTAVPVTNKLASLAAKTIVEDIGSYYAVWRCDQLLYVLTDMNAVNKSYPQCIQAGVNPADVFVAVHAAKGNRLTSSSAVRVTFGMALWVSLLIHTIGVEIYIRLTESSNQHRRGFVLERNDDDITINRADDH